MRKVTSLILVCTLFLGMYSIPAKAWTYTSYINSPAATTTYNAYSDQWLVYYDTSSSYYLYKNQIEAVFAIGQQNLASGISRVSTRKANVEVHECAGISDYLVAAKYWVNYHLFNDGFYCPYPVWNEISVTNGLVESDGSAELRIKLLVSAHVNDVSTYIAANNFKYSYGIDR